MTQQFILQVLNKYVQVKDYLILVPLAGHQRKHFETP